MRACKPKKKVLLVRVSAADPVPGDSANSDLKKQPRADPLLSDPRTSAPYPIPACQEEWQEVAERVFRDSGLLIPVQVAYDSLRVEI